MKNKNQQSTLQTAVRAGLALASFSDREPEISVSRLAQLMDLPASTAYRLLASLTAAGLVEQDSNTKRYRLSWLMFMLGNTVINRIGFGGQTDAAMRALADHCGETVNLGVRSSGSVVYVRKIESTEMLRADTPIGSRVPLHCTALGKLLLAYLNEDEINSELGPGPFHQWTNKTITNLKDLKHELAIIRSRGYSIDDEEFQNGVRGMACPIQDRRCSVIAGLSIGAPASRFADTRLRELEPILRMQANTISLSLGCPESGLLSPV
ncbi:MAG: IclR family transcriptional regulator [Anaerolineales bacterium]|jgi:DNA-binding IclR family transcriptional regulator